MNAVRKFLREQYDWYVLNLQKIIFILGLHIVSSYLVQLPYINIFTSLFAFLPYFFDWVAILILFRPSEEKILKLGLILFVVSFPFALIRFTSVLEILGQASFFAIGTYVILSLKEIKKN